MKSVMVKDRQNLMDFTMQEYGNPAAIIDLCLDNDLELDDNIYAGKYLNVQDTYPETADSDYADYISQNQIVIVSINEQDESLVLGTNDDDYIITNDNNYISS